MTESVSQMSNLGNEETLPPINVSVSKKRRNLPGRPDPDAEVIALSPRSLLTTNRFVCEICSKGFQRDQNLQLHRRGHNLPWRLKQKESHEYRKKVYICPELNCVHHDPARALGDLTGIKKHFSRKHGEKKWKCDKCSKRYAVQSDWKAHQKTCGTKEYRCDCGYLFSRKDSFITHRAFCDVLENNKDLPCNDEQEQKPAASADENANKITIEMDTPTPMDASASPVSPVTCDEGPCMKPPKPNLTERGSDTAISESGVVALSSKWPQGGISANNCGSHQGSELSLRLGSDLGPGPPNDAQVAVTQKTPVPIFGYPSPRGSNKLGFSQLASAESQISSKHVPSVGAMGMLASLFSSSAHRQSGVDGIDSVAHSFSISDHDHCSLSAGLSSSAYDLKSAYGPSRTYLPTSSAATSATALLQKAAELGAKASNPSMLQWYGKGDRDSKMSTNMQETARGSPWSGFSASHAASVQVKARQSEDHVKSAEFWGSTSSSLSQKSDNIHVTGLSDNVCLPASALLNVPFQAKVHANSSLALKHGHVKEKENSSTTQSDSGFEMGCIQHEDGRSQTCDVENRMVDFLGVNASRAVISGSSAGMAQILSQRDLASVPSLMPGIRVSKRFQYPNSSVGQ